jgi:hypothetical protein
MIPMSSPTLRRAAVLLLALLATLAFAAPAGEVTIDFEQAEIGKPTPTWSDKGVVFGLASEPAKSKAKGRVMFFPYISTDRKGILNAMANEQNIPVQAKFPNGASSVTLVLWGSTGCPAKLEAFDKNDKLIDEVSLASVPGRKTPAEPVPQFEMTVKGAEIAYIRLSGPRTGEFLAADELRFVPLAAK